MLLSSLLPRISGYKAKKKYIQSKCWQILFSSISLITLLIESDQEEANLFYLSWLIFSVLEGALFFPMVDSVILWNISFVTSFNF